MDDRAARLCPDSPRAAREWLRAMAVALALLINRGE